MLLPRKLSDRKMDSENGSCSGEKCRENCVWWFCLSSDATRDEECDDDDEMLKVRKKKEWKCDLRSNVTFSDATYQSVANAISEYFWWIETDVNVWFRVEGNGKSEEIIWKISIICSVVNVSAIQTLCSSARWSVHDIFMLNICIFNEQWARRAEEVKWEISVLSVNSSRADVVTS